MSKKCTICRLGLAFFVMAGSLLLLDFSLKYRYKPTYIRTKGDDSKVFDNSWQLRNVTARTEHIQEIIFYGENESDHHSKTESNKHSEHGGDSMSLKQIGSGKNSKECGSASNYTKHGHGFQIVGYNYTHVKDCLARGCELNDKRSPVKILSCDTAADKRVAEKVTVVVKTIQRLTSVMRLIESLHSFYPGVKVIVVDDHFNITLPSPEQVKSMHRLWREFMAKFHGLVKYIKLPGNAGLAKGRNTGLKDVKSEYFLLLDDDFIITNQTNITKMVDILDRTDLTLVAGTLANNGPFICVLRIHPSSTGSSLQPCEYMNMAYEEVPSFPSCYAVDYVLNLFLARTKNIREIGGWNNNLLVNEHRDFMFRLRKAGYKIAVCTDIELQHKRIKSIKYDLGYRKVALHKYSAIFQKEWNISEPISYTEPRLYYNYICNH
ncbi:beta-1,4 N-acetylgalactosaminyltransferase 1 [Lingula anatina]|uniref:Beta-1,4 N-acetylgalactosaminyltransferase 1 n=1 Tax=Lingula anatina TaxID=7574 RepID=A0A1S3IDH5_LINAN|nr:beta-1,4 N-acetylgalactosaminyltransferase 1 [Lingula anatina]|eukprot:XP_013395489.1 beta-1,4 N-acetylgalactosaminyltransferase 1 [Lingula anatina]